MTAASAAIPVDNAAGLAAKRLATGAKNPLINEAPTCITFFSDANNLSYGLAAISLIAPNLVSPSSSTALANA